ncbi:histidine kinase [Paenibacillus oenotherae]|uniref:histidine kinase n=1 Tax=Paenibacillus oenotherae TaxID=1435645 RepID=A0ABS7D3R5_9BACL|nr:sensor histidine kinase [Paenibacillus oenotherae]MBW7474111.1 histidine kinase [Paenibacillus oenotherae]
MQSGPMKPAAAEGELDLRDWSFQHDGALTLSGEWAFYSHQLLGARDSFEHVKKRYAIVPRSWNSYPDSYGVKNGQGYATYRLSVRIEPTSRILALRMPNISSAYKLWINGNLLASVGKVGTSRETVSAEQFPRIISFDGRTDRLDIIIQVANFQHRKGGIWVDIKLGDSNELVGSQMRTTAQEMIILGSLFIIGIYHIGLYAFRRREQFTVYFGLLCLLVAARIGVTGEGYLMQTFSFISWEAGLKIEYISFAFSAVTGFLYVYTLFPPDMSKLAKRLTLTFGLLLSIFVLAVPAIVFTRLLVIYQLFVLAAGVYALIVLIKAVVRKRDGAPFVLAGLLVFVLTVLNDILFYNEWGFYNQQLVPLGLFFFILMQSFIISTRFSSALFRVEQVSKELRELNTHLEDRIEERTEALRGANETLEKANKELAKMENSRRQLMTNISHDLGTPMTLLQGYLEAMQDGMVTTEEQRSKYVRMMLGKVGGVNRLIRDLFELSKLEAGQLRFHYIGVNLQDWIERHREQYEMDVRGKGLLFESKYIQGGGNEGELHPERIVLQLDLFRMDQVVANIIYNAIKHTGEGGKITLAYSFERSSGRVSVRVKDTGSGIEAEHLPYIFDRFYKKEMSRNSADGGSGLGLAIAKEIVEAHSGMIGAESVPEEGTVIWLSLPASLQ